MDQQFEEADRLTSEHLRQLAGEAAVQRGYVYYSEVPPIASVDLESIDRLWVMYSQGRFGFSVQIRLLRSLNGRWDQLWPRLGWKQGGVWTRYPRSFTWSLEAPEGHLPLVNQLRGVRLMDALLSTRPATARIGLSLPCRRRGSFKQCAALPPAGLRWHIAGPISSPPSTLQLAPLLEVLLEPISCVEQLSALQLGLQEVLVNAVRHGNANDPAKCLRIRRIVTPRWWVFQVQDQGCGLPLEARSVHLPIRPTRSAVGACF